MGCSYNDNYFPGYQTYYGTSVSAEEEIQGLDIKEHGLASAYDGFTIRDAVASVPVPMGTSREFTVTPRPSAPAEFIPEIPADGVHKLYKGCYHYPSEQAGRVYAGYE